MMSMHFSQARGFTLPLRRFVRSSRLAQVGLMLGLWWAGCQLSQHLALPVPGAIVGLALALALLASGRVSQASLRHGANWLLADMLLFFVPAVLAVLNHREFLGLLGLKLLAVIACGTIVVMAVTAVVVELCFRCLER
ncbi:holin-like protein CidA [mine drainage metagenome]|uniref:Holin-like protein CidA n=1 Tax=mine drainage metagenome TaxID=410659 RepID=A0A1J5RR21_9ZZZZ